MNGCECACAGSPVCITVLKPQTFCSRERGRHQGFVPGIPSRMTVLHYLVKMNPGASEDVSGFEEPTVARCPYLVHRGLTSRSKTPSTTALRSAGRDTKVAIGYWS